MYVDAVVVETDHPGGSFVGLDKEFPCPVYCFGRVYGREGESQKKWSIVGVGSSKGGYVENWVILVVVMGTFDHVRVEIEVYQIVVLPVVTPHARPSAEHHSGIVLSVRIVIPGALAIVPSTFEKLGHDAKRPHLAH